jgi:hypothetical protein
VNARLQNDYYSLTIHFRVQLEKQQPPSNSSSVMALHLSHPMQKFNFAQNAPKHST